MLWACSVILELLALACILNKTLYSKHVHVDRLECYKTFDPLRQSSFVRNRLEFGLVKSLNTSAREVVLVTLVQNAVT